MKKIRPFFRTAFAALTLALPLIALAALLTLGVACASEASMDELQGLLQATDGGKAVITLEDGSKVRVEVDRAAGDATAMVGQDVQVKIKTGDDSPKLVEIKKAPAREAPAIPGLRVAPEDFHFSGAIASMGADTWTIGGKSFKVNAATMLDQGLAAGVAAEVEFIMLSDGSLLATKIETEAPDEVVLAPGAQGIGNIAEDFSLTGVVQSLAPEKIVVGSKTLKIDANTALDTGVKVGALVRAEVVPQADGSLLALELETDASNPELARHEDFTASGPIQSIDAGSVMIDGRKFKIDAGTELDSGLAPGVLAKVEFAFQPDGAMLAREVETTGFDEGVNLYFSGPIETMSATDFVIGGRTFKVAPATVLDDGLAVGVVANVSFTVQPDGSLVAVKIEDTGFEFTGPVQAVSPGAYTIGGRVFNVGALTHIDQGLKVRKLALVKFTAQPDGAFLAREIKSAKTKLLGFSFKGVVQSVSPTSLAASQQSFQMVATTTMGAGVAPGIEVIVRFDIQPDGSLIAQSVQRAAAAKK